MGSKTHTKYKLLLDEGLPHKESYPLLNNYFNLRHIVHDFSHGGVSDKKVYALANKEGRMVIVFNTKDFRPLISHNSVSVISLSTNLTDKQVELKLNKILKNMKPSEIKGHLISVTNVGTSIIKHHGQG